MIITCLQRIAGGNWTACIQSRLIQCVILLFPILITAACCLCVAYLSRMFFWLQECSTEWQWSQRGERYTMSATKCQLLVTTAWFLIFNYCSLSIASEFCYIFRILSNNLKLRKLLCDYCDIPFRQEAQLLLGDRATRKHAKDCWNGRWNDNLCWNDLQNVLQGHQKWQQSKASVWFPISGL